MPATATAKALPHRHSFPWHDHAVKNQTASRLGRTFPYLAAYLPDDRQLTDLATSMVETAAESADSALDNPEIPAGFTYLCQFVDHDISLEPRLNLESVFRLSTGLDGDPRNQEHWLACQTQLAFLQFHNKVISTLNISSEEARRITTWHYQWIVLHELVSKLVSKPVLDSVLNQGRVFYRYTFDSYLPVEFAAAANRFYPSMSRASYVRNPEFFPSEADTWAIDWSRYYDVQPYTETASLQLSRRITPRMAPSSAESALACLLRGKALGLPCGQSVASAMGLSPLTPDEVQSGIRSFDFRTPLWYYVLREAQVRSDGKHLGPVAARLVAETFVGLLEGDPDSFLAQQPDWRPTLPSEIEGAFTMGDLFRFIGAPYAAA